MYVNIDLTKFCQSAALQQDLKSKDEEADVSRSDSESKIAAQVAFNELQSIIKGYQDLSGLSFEKAEMGRLRYDNKSLNIIIFILSMLPTPSTQFTCFECTQILFQRT